ncbi:prephenate dehydrogenase [Roseibacillus ishigakijimensis]|uniref:Prephenate dehydrogenase/arogenate dehydrogenase family protein n=1 Tax=Roseibacillus ishigakijimensis TaxID=454146 RepID=A0A934RQK5_9BACT|nr:prephenate dehydrogenase/arogenate dehydrogenase family protein [Roseibacillus ishigakijimensis]MBK1834057.1 prephenate dehydrogenase/arogenate dehydrogenase family protein [Roseibacillus ishigakijimensis]
MAFGKIAVLGPGLLGGSVGLAVRERELGTVRFWGRSEEKLARVREEGFMAERDLARVVAGVDMVILATPVEFYRQLAEQLVALGGDFLVTDVGSVKAAVAEGAGEVLAAAGIPFIGSHPMAGSEQGGFEVARADLFVGACCFLCGDPSSSHFPKLAAFWQALGCTTVQRTAREHDEIVARISHLPHVLAAVGAQVSLRNPGEEEFGGGGLADTTRVAAGNPPMWTGILLENRAAILHELARAREELAQVESLLASGEKEKLSLWLEEACQRRNRLSHRS